MNVPADLRYTDQHEWIRVEGDTGTMGITDFAQHALSDVTYVELPEVDREFAKGDELGAIESCKAAASFYAPLGGKVVEVNESLDDEPGVINTDPYGAGWVCKLALSDASEAGKLMDAKAYEAFCGDEN